MSASSFEQGNLSSSVYIIRPTFFALANSFTVAKLDSIVVIRPSIKYSADIKPMGEEINYDNPSLEFPTVYGYIQ